MKRHPALRLAGLALASLFGLVPMLAATALPGRAEARRTPVLVTPYAMEVLVDGQPLTSYAARGTTYVEALKGAEYAIRLTNRTGERVAVALAVDGLNSIDARHTSARDARKWILAPWESVTLSGWQTSSGTARRFVFTTESKSYGSWLGRTSDLGIISAAFFRERPRPGVSPSEAPVSGRLKDEGSARPEAAPERKTAGAPSDELGATGIGGGV